MQLFAVKIEGSAHSDGARADVLSAPDPIGLVELFRRRAGLPPAQDDGFPLVTAFRMAREQGFTIYSGAVAAKGVLANYGWQLPRINDGDVRSMNCVPLA